MTIPVISGLVAMFFWGINAFFEKKSIDRIGTFKSAIFVHLFLIIYGIPVVLFNLEFPVLDFDFFVGVILLGFMDFMGLVLFYQAFKVAKISVVTPIASSYAIVVAIMSFLFFGEDFGILKMALVIVIVTGILLLSIDLDELRKNKKSNIKGIAYAICIFLIYGIFTPLWDKFIAQGGWPFIVEIERFVILFFSLFFLLLKSKRLELRIDKKSLYYTVAIALCIGTGSTVFGWGLYNSTQTSIIAAISSAYPLVVALVAYIFLRERLRPNQYVGIVVVLIGLILITLL
ncbi:MAG: hypothetical protein US52_C0018G0005 [candidate division WS6 bacterium GW2011_GWA2_37_6]|uniref:EamA domain-containing protein n=1 Tax=candidate division WS6 bacterium GW2011_GWA2_37_6 TaxID=1619087 RepID=A0A0G0H0I5_9BACT|nr:MAG: hypothetical protein US52_C0018G0005 [candidate division WS6 bacterium GW2011_GWA2_37_6]